MKNKTIKIFTLTHKKFNIPTDTTYVPLQVGAATHDKLGYLTDDTGDNISDLNCYYSELTGLYWVWKNVRDVDYVGICHYRRFLLNDDEYVFTKDEMISLLDKEKNPDAYDILTSKSLDLNFSYHYGFGENHTIEEIDAAGEVIKELYPDFYPLYDKRVNENHTYFGNIMICSKQLLDEYCEFLFPIFEVLHARINLEDHDDYHKRLYGFISEFLLFVWCEYKKLKVKECKVGIIGEKKETREAKEKLYEYISNGKISEAKTYFLDLKKKRPDILMEASDITGELHLCIQLISICEFELASYGKILAPVTLSFADLMKWVYNLNTSVIRNLEFSDNYSDEAIYVARQIYNSKREN